MPNISAPYVVRDLISSATEVTDEFGEMVTYYCRLERDDGHEETICLDVVRVSQGARRPLQAGDTIMGWIFENSHGVYFKRDRSAKDLSARVRDLEQRLADLEELVMESLVR